MPGPTSCPAFSERSGPAPIGLSSQFAGRHRTGARMTDFSAMYSRYAADVFRFALFLSGDRGEAEDITSETFVRAWTAPGPIEASTVKGYLFTIARHLYLKTLRRRSRHADPVDPATLEERMADPQAGPQARME